MQPIRITTSLVALAAAGTLAACHTRTDDAANSATTSTTVERIETPAPTPTPTSTPIVVQTQPGPGGSVVTLNKVHVTGDVLTVQLTFTGKDAVPVLPLDQISLIDDATAQRIGMLKDNSGQWMASPLGSNGKDLNVNLFQSPAIVWLKFPAPPATSKTVSLNIPEVAPFDGVPVTR